MLFAYLQVSSLASVDVSNAVQTKYADLTGGPVPVSPSVLEQTPMKKPSAPAPAAMRDPVMRDTHTYTRGADSPARPAEVR